MTTTQPLSFTLSDGISTAEPKAYDLAYTTFNPLSQIKPTNGDWRYHLYYYSGTNNQQQTLTCTATDPTKTVYVCAFAPGGVGGLNKFVNGSPFGGGGGGQCVNKEFVSSATVTLNPITNTPPSPTTIQSSTFITTTNPNGVFTLRSGGPGGIGILGSGKGKGGPGGSGGGAGGNGGDQGSNYNYTPGVGGPDGTDSGNGFSANSGNGYNGLGQYYINYNVVSTKQIFSDGTTANLASGGMSGRFYDYEYFNGQSGNTAGVMFYYKV